MKIVINDFNSNYQETISLRNFDNINETFKKFFPMKGPLEAKFCNQ